MAITFIVLGLSGVTAGPSPVANLTQTSALR